MTFKADVQQQEYDREYSLGALATENEKLKAQRDVLLAALDPLMGEAKGDTPVSAFGPVSKFLSMPFFSAGELVRTAKNQAGQTNFAAQNKKLFV